MLDLPQTKPARDRLRLELQEYLITHASEPWMWELMSNACELDTSDTAVLQLGYLPLAPLDSTPTALAVVPYAPSASIDGPAVPLPPSSSQVDLPPETLDALCWLTGTKNQAIVTSLRDKLPVSTILHHVDLYKEHLAAQAASGALSPLPDKRRTPFRLSLIHI